MVLLAIWIAAGGVVGGIGLAISELKKSRPAAAQAMSIERTPPRQNRNPWSRWSLTEHRSAHNMLVAHVETDHLDEAVAIAQQLAEPVKGRYEEVLIYFHRPGRPDTLPPRPTPPRKQRAAGAPGRVQWTLTTGYVETVHE